MVMCANSRQHDTPRTKDRGRYKAEGGHADDDDKTDTHRKLAHGRKRGQLELLSLQLSSVCLGAPHDLRVHGVCLASVAVPANHVASPCIWQPHDKCQRFLSFSLVLSLLLLSLSPTHTHSCSLSAFLPIILFYFWLSFLFLSFDKHTTHTHTHTLSLLSLSSSKQFHEKVVHSLRAVSVPMPALVPVTMHTYVHGRCRKQRDRRGPRIPFLASLVGRHLVLG